MIPHDTKKAQINPRRLVLEGREKELYAALCQTGYVPAENNFSDFCESLKSGRAWLISGTRGSGKTAFPEAVASACNLTICIVAGRDGLKQEEILYDWDREEQATWMRENLDSAKFLPENEREEFMKQARREKWKRDFLILGEMGLAYDLAAKSAKGTENNSKTNHAPPILILDESDKFGASIEDSMLMPLERGLIYIPRLTEGFIGISDRRFHPIVVTTSNDLRHKLSAPFVSRHVFSSFATPPLLKELEILRARVPQASSVQLALTIKLLDGVRGVAGLEDYPSLRESIDVAFAFVRDGVRDLEQTTITKFRADKPKVSYLYYPDFDTDAHPALHSSMQANLSSLYVDFRDYSSSENPPILHRKETFVEETYLHYKKFAKITAQEEKFGLLDNPTSIGTRKHWQQRLFENKVELNGHRIIKSGNLKRVGKEY